MILSQNQIPHHMENYTCLWIENLQCDIGRSSSPYSNCFTQTNSPFSMNIFHSVSCTDWTTMNKNQFDVHVCHAFCQENYNVQYFYTMDYFCRCGKNPSRAECVSFHLDFSECNQKNVVSMTIVIIKVIFFVYAHYVRMENCVNTLLVDLQLLLTLCLFLSH